jgi:arginase
MGLAIATGSCWKKLALSIPNFRPIPGANILLIGGRDFDEGEKERLEQAGVTVVDNAAFQEKGVHPALSTYLRKVEEAHLHIDLDVLNPKQTPANSFLMDDEGLSAGQLSEAIGLIKQNMKVTSATIASYDPAYDPEGKTLRASFELIKQIVYR